MALARSPLVRATIVGCSGALALALTACGTLSRATHADSVVDVGPPRTIEAALPPDGEIGSGATATAPEADLTLLAAAPRDAATARAGCRRGGARCRHGPGAGRLDHGYGARRVRPLGALQREDVRRQP